MRYQVKVRAGQLSIDTRREAMPLIDLLDFASRQNPRRGFLFVSKVLGKHIPCRPALMRGVYEQLAEPLSALPAPVVVIGMAETATGLAGGVAHSLARARAVLYMHTTRHAIGAPLLLCFDENHSHAPDHLLYQPLGECADIFQRARGLVLVDDEISTGRTLRLLGQGVLGHLPALREIRLVSIVNWLSPRRRQELIADFPRPVDFVSLVEGEFTFTPDPSYQPMLPANVEARRANSHARPDSGRTGLLLPAKTPLPSGPLPDGPLVVVGTGEFTFAPFLVAEALEQEGRDVLFQSTTRSPIAEGEAIRGKLTFADEHGEGVTNYLYNLPPDRRVVVAYEHPAMAAAHDFPRRVGAAVWTLPWP